MVALCILKFYFFDCYFNILGDISPDSGEVLDTKNRQKLLSKFFSDDDFVLFYS
jgi:hypothetical protein